MLLQRSQYIRPSSTYNAFFRVKVSPAVISALSQSTAILSGFLLISCMPLFFKGCIGFMQGISYYGQLTHDGC